MANRVAEAVSEYDCGLCDQQLRSASKEPAIAQCLVWLLTLAIPVLKPGQKLVIDNATFHKTLKRLVKSGRL